MRLRLVAVVGVVLVGVAAFAPASLGAIRITRILYNPPGDDTQANSQLVKEFIEIKNTGRGPVGLTNWSIIDVDDNKRFKFPRFTLAGRAVVRIRSGAGRNTRTDLYWGHDNYIWNNDETETAVVRNAKGAVVARCQYRAGSGASASCPR